MKKLKSPKLQLIRKENIQKEAPSRWKLLGGLVALLLMEANQLLNCIRKSVENSLSVEQRDFLQTEFAVGRRRNEEKNFKN